MKTIIDNLSAIDNKKECKTFLDDLNDTQIHALFHEMFPNQKSISLRHSNKKEAILDKHFENRLLSLRKTNLKNGISFDDLKNNY